MQLNSCFCSGPQLIADIVPQPIIDYPQQTTRCAIDIVFRGVLTTHPNINIILSHAGGTLPFLGQRALIALKDAGPANTVEGFPTAYILEGLKSAGAFVSYEEGKKAFSRFYFDVALSTGK